MRACRHPARRPMRRPVFLVKATGGAAVCIDEARAQGYSVGLRAAELIYEYFPAFYAETGMNTLTVTPELLLGCCAAFWQLVEGRGLPLRWPGDMGGGYDGGMTRAECEATPAETLRMVTAVSDEYLSECGHALMMPRPCYFGHGVYVLLDDESDNYPSSPLTILLWHLYQHTPLGLGVPIDLAMASNIDEDLALDLLRLKPLPSSAPIHLLCAHLDIPAATRHGVKPYDLIAYAFAKTGNALADCDDYEVEAIYMGEIDEGWDWSEIDRLAMLARDAEALAEAYDDWREDVVDWPALRTLAGQLHKACRKAERELQAPPKTLITLLGYEDDEGTDIGELMALLSRQHEEEMVAA